MSLITVDPIYLSGDTAWVGTGEANASGATPPQVSASTRRRTAARRGRALLGGSVFNSRAVGPIAVVPEAEHDLRRVDPRRAAFAASPPSPAAASRSSRSSLAGAREVDRRRCVFVDVHPQRRRHHRRAAPATRPRRRTARRARRAASAASSSTRRNPSIVYAGAYARGVWRSTNAGVGLWTQIHTPLVNSAAVTTSRPEIASTYKNGKTVMYIAEGASGAPTAQVYRTDDAQAATPCVVDPLTSSSRADPLYGTFNYCTGQCWYDNFVVTPKGLARRRLRRRLVRVRRDGEHLQRSRCRPLAGRRTDLERHDDGRDGLPASERPASRPALPRDEPVEPAPVLRVERRRDHAVERRLHERAHSSARRVGSRAPTSPAASSSCRACRRSWSRSARVTRRSSSRASR